jgi:ribosomal protein S18 acetylase RimI-like enzyme
VELLDAQARLEHATLLVAEREGAVVGTVTMALPGTAFAEVSRPDEAGIRMLAVDEDARGAGIASQLMDACEAYAREAGLAGVVLWTESSMHAAHRLYERRGYARESIQPGLGDTRIPTRRRPASALARMIQDRLVVSACR